MFHFYASSICAVSIATSSRKVVVGLARALVAVRESVKLRREEEPTKLSALYLLIKLNEVHGMVTNCQFINFYPLFTFGLIIIVRTFRQYHPLPYLSW